MEVFGHFVFPRFSGFFQAFPFVYRLFRAFLFTILFRHFVLPPIILKLNNINYFKSEDKQKPLLVEKRFCNALQTAYGVVFRVADFVAYP